MSTKHHNGYGQCTGSGQVWVDDGSRSNFYRGGSCPRCAPRPPPDAGGVVEALENIKFLSGDSASPVMDAWDNARTHLLNGVRGSLPRDIMEAGLSIIYEAATEALASLSPRAGEEGDQEAACTVSTATREPISRAAPEAEPTGWRDISTAPKDRPIIIAVTGGDKPAVVGEAWWQDESCGGDWWWMNTSPGDYYSDPIREVQHGAPTHWMPLPKAPAKLEGEG
jgi:hypothetical protein